MRFFIVQDRPTRDQLNAIEAERIDGKILSLTREGWHVVAFDDAEYPVPRWLQGQRPVNIPGHTHYGTGGRSPEDIIPEDELVDARE